MLCQTDGDETKMTLVTYFADGINTAMGTPNTNASRPTLSTSVIHTDDAYGYATNVQNSAMDVILLIHSIISRYTQ